MERRHINPSGIHKHPAFTRVITVKGPAKMVFVAGQTPSDEAYRPVAVGDYRGQYLKVLESLTAQLEALWTEQNTATDGTTAVEGEYLEVHAIRA